MTEKMPGGGTVGPTDMTADRLTAQSAELLVKFNEQSLVLPHQVEAELEQLLLSLPAVRTAELQAALLLLSIKGN